MKKQRARLRTRKLADGRESMYIDVYTDGRRSYEFLHLYLLPANSRAAIAANKETMRRAEIIRQSREADATAGIFRHAAKLTLRGVIGSITEAVSPSRRYSYRAAVAAALRYAEKGDINVSDINQVWLSDYTEWLRYEVRAGHYMQNTAEAYYKTLISLLRRAEAAGASVCHDAYRAYAPKREETRREYLTISELRRLIDTPCANPTIRNSFLFSCLTGLRYSDVMKLTWREVCDDADSCRIIFRQRKTGLQEYYNINAQARALLGVRGDEAACVFKKISQPYIYAPLREWAQAAGIHKHITFHSARHTFATMMLTLGVDIYTVSKLLGHRNIATTQIYAKIIDKKKEEAVQLIPDFAIEKSSH
ncbi:MAG: tyrosine-type recombinase/integrase [Muribaculaceae bacterium]